MENDKHMFANMLLAHMLIRELGLDSCLVYMTVHLSLLFFSAISPMAISSLHPMFSLFLLSFCLQAYHYLPYSQQLLLTHCPPPTITLFLFYLSLSSSWSMLSLFAVSTFTLPTPLLTPCSLAFVPDTSPKLSLQR